MIDLMQARVARNVLRETILELGVEEFHTRTGYECERGKAILDQLDNEVDHPPKNHRAG
jgi:hypothetical protein